MRTILSCFLSLVVLAALEGQVLDSLGCTGAVGDVKYSILDEAAFQAENGPCWVLLDGRDISGSRLAALIGQTNLPDARGYFIRSADTRSDDRVDKDRKQGQIGTIQNDTLGSHSHDVDKYGLMRISQSTDPKANTVEDHDKEGAGTEPDVITTPIKMGSTLGHETRPKNINLYVYIRIN